MPLDAQDLKRISDLTLDHYEARAEQFWQGTRDHDVKQNIATLLQYVEGEPPFTILDFGCGPGRDLRAFTELGHVAVGLEGAAHFSAMARRHSGCQVWQQDFLALDLPAGHFDGVFANASLFHVPSQELPRVLLQLRATLRPGGVLFARTRTATMRKAGAAAAMARITIPIPGAATCRRRDLSSSITISARQACRAHSSLGWRASGVGEERANVVGLLGATDPPVPGLLSKQPESHYHPDVFAETRLEYRAMASASHRR